MASPLHLAPLDRFASPGSCAPGRRADSARVSLSAIRSRPPHEYPRACRLFRQGDAVRAVQVLVDGLVKLVHTGRGGRESIVGLGQSPSLLGSCAALLDEPHLVSCESLSPCQIQFIEVDEFRGLVRGDTEFAGQLQRQHAREVTEQIEWNIRLALPPRARFESLLRALQRQGHIAPWGNEFRLNPRIRRRDLAEMIHVCPEQLSRLLADAERQGMVARVKEWLIVRHTLDARV